MSKKDYCYEKHPEASGCEDIIPPNEYKKVIDKFSSERAQA